MRINQYEFRQNGVEFEPTKQQIVQFATDQLAKDDKRIAELEDTIKVKDMLIEQLENQNDRLIEQRDTQEQQLAICKRALEIAYREMLRYYADPLCIDEETWVKIRLNSAKKELEEKNA